MTSRYRYRAIDGRGQPHDGIMDAASPEEVGTWLADRSYFVLEVAPAPLSDLAQMQLTPTRLSTRELNYFFLQLSSLINAGCPLIMSLQALHRQLDSGNLKTLLKDLKEKIEMGKSFSEALKGHPGSFSNLFITMVEVGEIGGILDQVLDQYAKIHDSFSRIRGKLITSMIYPALLGFLTLVVSLVLLVFVFPVFLEQIQARGGQLPLPTQIVMGLSEFLIAIFRVVFAPIRVLPFSPWIAGPPYLFLLSIGVFWAGTSLWRIEAARRAISGAILATPGIGAVALKTELALFSRTLGTLLRCGVPILTSLAAVERAQGNQSFKDALSEMKNGVARGESVTTGMGRRRDLFPDSLILMADVGERGGNIGEMLEKAAVFYERDLETTIEMVVSLVEPLLVIFMAGFIGLLALAMYLPLFDIIKVVR